jgi:cysteinyl-tRNA synthetase
VLTDLLADDLNTPEALAFLSQASTQLQTVHIEKDMVDHFEAMLQGIDDLLGLNLSAVADISDEHKALIKRREAARAKQNWTQSDTIRDQLAAQGIGLHDAVHGAIWFRL